MAARQFLLRLAVCTGLLAAMPEAPGADLVLADFNGQGFNYTFDDFNETIGTESVRITDPFNSWGGAGVVPGTPLDLSASADGRLVIDFTPEAGNSSPDFTIELVEQIAGSQTSKSGKWTFNLNGLQPGVPTRVVSTSRLNEPESGIGDFQSLDLASISQWQVLGAFGAPGSFDVSFDRIAISESAPPYPGAEPDAPWRAAAASRIEDHRKAGHSVRVVDASGAPVPGAQVQVAMQQHAFGFGSAVQAFRLRDNASQHAEYKNKVAELFNLATLENNLKWPAWEGEWGSLWSQAGAINAIDWLNGQGIDARGHVMVWPGESNLPADLRQLLSDDSLSPAEQQVVRDRIATHIASIAGVTDGKVVAWDVINETRTNNDLMRELAEGDAAMVTWFEQARAASPDAKLYLNDFGILNSWGRGSNRDQYFSTLEALQQQGAAIDGVGFQGHFRESDITGPEELWSIMDRFEALGLDMQVTEFDFETTDEELQAQYTRDFLTAMFAHEGVDDVILWGFWEDAHWRPDAAMFRSDWSIKPNGEAYLDLLFNEWWTDEVLQADEAGEAIVRGFKGDYAVTATAGSVSASQDTVLLADGEETLLVLPMLLGDYNDDGRVDAADYTVWREAAVSQDLAADGNHDGIVDAGDYQIWASRYGATAPGSTTSVPEPASIVLVAWLLFRAPRASNR